MVSVRDQRHEALTGVMEMAMQGQRQREGVIFEKCFNEFRVTIYRGPIDFDPERMGAPHTYSRGSCTPWETGAPNSAEHLGLVV